MERAHRRRRHDGAPHADIARPLGRVVIVLTLDRGVEALARWIHPERGLIGAATSAPFNGIGRTMGGLNRDIRQITDAVRVLPELLEVLRTIDRRATSLDREVREMRRAVLKIHGDIGELTAHVDDLGNSLHPLGRIRNRLRRESPIEGEESTDPASPEPPAGG